VATGTATTPSVKSDSGPFPVVSSRVTNIDTYAAIPAVSSSGGNRYRDLTVGGGKVAQQGDAVEIRYRVMRLGTRARDGLSGEGQTIFSYGYGEDEDKEGDIQVRRVSYFGCNNIVLSRGAMQLHAESAPSYPTSGG